MSRPAPASFAEKVLRIQPRSDHTRKRLNFGSHLALGTLWGATYGLAAHTDLRGQKGVAAIFDHVVAPPSTAGPPSALEAST